MSILIYTVVGICLLILSMRFALLISAKRKKGTKVVGLKGDFAKSVENEAKSLFYFYGPSCPPCFQMTPVVERLQKKHQGIFKIDVSKDMDTASKFGVMGTPSLVLVENGLISEFLFGPQPEHKIQQLLA